VRKPDPRFFELVLAAIGEEPQACLLIDDRAVNCAAAERLGLRTHLFDGAAGLRARLVEEDILPSP
jgi:FMN hydrolase / 5-amino-6-(5-phospho-D-ribitylamino)uracil phosphatase